MTVQLDIQLNELNHVELRFNLDVSLFVLKLCILFLI